MEIKRLDWDSGFFGVEIYAVEPGNGDSGDAADIRTALTRQGAAMAYIFLQEDRRDWHDRLSRQGAILYDEKITYGKQLSDEPATPSGTVFSYEGGMTPDLERLSILSGHESRFKKDPRLSARFEPLYLRWMGTP